MIVSSDLFKSKSSSTSMWVPSKRIRATLSRTSKKLSNGKSSCPSCTRRNSLISSNHLFTSLTSVENIIASTRSLPKGDKQCARSKALTSLKPIFCSKFFGYIIVSFYFLINLRRLSFCLLHISICKSTKIYL